MVVDVLSILEGKWEDGTRPKDIYTKHIADGPQKYLSIIIQGLTSSNRRVQNGAAEIASLLSEEYPELVYPHIAIFASNLDSKAPVLRWEAVNTIGNLVEVDVQGKVPSYINQLMGHLDNKSIVLQGYAVKTLAKVAGRYSKYSKEILNTLISKVDKFPGNRVGFIIEAMEHFREYPTLIPEIQGFIEPYLDSDVKVVTRKAKRILKSFDAQL